MSSPRQLVELSHLLIESLDSQFHYVYYLPSSTVVNVDLYKFRLEDSYLSGFTRMTLTL